MRTHPRRSRLAIALATVGALAMTACAGPGTTGEGGTPQEGGDLQFGIVDDLGCVDMRQTTLRSLFQIARQTTDSLVYMGADGEASPWLAESWEINDDATEYTFHLRDDVTFADGSAFTATTVQANLDSLLELGAAAQIASVTLQSYEGTEVVDEHTATVRFSAPNASFLYAISTPALGMYSDESTVLSGDELCQGEFVTSGPYQVDEYVQSERTVLVRNDDYAWGPDALENVEAGHVDTITYNVITDPAVMLGNALGGELDIALGIAPDDEQQALDAGWTRNDEPDAALSASWLIRLGNGVAGNNPEVRDAMAIGIDRDALMSVAGLANEPATGVFNPAHPYYTDQSDALAYDPDEASAILDEAGWEVGDDGIRVRDGERLTVDVIYYTEGTGPIMELAQQQLEEVGIELELHQLTSQENSAQRIEGSFEARIDWYTGPEPTGIASALADLNPTQEMLDLVDAQDATTDVAERSEIVAELSDLALDEGVIIPLYTQNSTPFATPGVTGRVSDVGGLLMLTQMQLLG